MSTQTIAPEQVRSRGVRALKKELGVAGMVQFMQEFGTGRGDYTKERRKVLDTLTLEEIHNDIREARKLQPARPRTRRH